ncbi:MAG: FtsX-like permease family protein [Sphingomonadales bacterium]
MLRNYLISAYRNILKNRMFAFINIVGLAVGLTVYVLSQLIAGYEATHDSFFAKAERIHLVSATFNPSRNIGALIALGVQTPIAPLMREMVPAAEVTARLYDMQYLVRVGDKVFYQPIRFAEDGFLRIFDFEFLAGSPETALADPSGLILTESTARKFFGEADPIGRTITVDRNRDLRVTALIRDLPKNSHFVSSLIVDDVAFEMIASDRVFLELSGYDADNRWGSMSSNYLTYALLREGVTASEANRQLKALYDQHVGEEIQKVILSIELMPLHKINLYPWEASGMPAILGIQLLGLLVLVIAGMNYANLATAQVMGRTREVGLRKTMGAGKRQLFAQFISESMLVAVAALLLALGLIEFALPALNSATGKAFSFGVLADPAGVAELVLLVALVGAVSGAYPALMISRGGTVQMLRGEFGKGRRGNWVRATLLVLQFTISIFMAVGVSIIYSQNQQIVKSGAVFDQDQILVIERIQQDGITENWATLKNEIGRIPGVGTVAFVNQPPFEQSNTNTTVTSEPGNQATGFTVGYMAVDENFLTALDIPLLAGRSHSLEVMNDKYRLDEAGEPVGGVLNVMINETAMRRLGVSEPAEALGKSFYGTTYSDNAREFRVVGVVPDINYRGFQNRVRPLMFMWIEENYRYMLVRIESGAPANVVDQIDSIWAKIVPDYPIKRVFLSTIFEEVYKVFKAVTGVIAGFATVALVLALFGLFGLAAIMAAKRTREIGIRKVLGAGTSDIVRLLIWQFTRPVAIGFLLAAPLGYFGARFYLDFFADRVALTPLPFLLAGGMALLFAWITVSGHAWRVARANPITALRYE